MHPYEAQAVKPISNTQAYSLRQTNHIYQPDHFVQHGHHIQYQHLRNSNDSSNNNSGSLFQVHSPGGKRKPLRGNRSVHTLSEAQLERKRANDREAQRAIRQRTKEQIENLQKRVAELSVHESASSELMATTKRNKELEEENLFLRSKLSQAINTLGRYDSAGELSRIYLYFLKCVVSLITVTSIPIVLLQWSKGSVRIELLICCSEFLSFYVFLSGNLTTDENNIISRSRNFAIWFKYWRYLQLQTNGPKYAEFLSA